MSMVFAVLKFPVVGWKLVFVFSSNALLREGLGYSNVSRNVNEISCSKTYKQILWHFYLGVHIKLNLRKFHFSC